MRYFYDLEFLDDGKSIELLSLGMVAEDGREFYGVNRDAEWHRVYDHDWLMANVVPSLPVSITAERAGDGIHEIVRTRFDDDPTVMTRVEITAGVLDLVGNDPYVHLWAYYGAYDHVCLMQQWGPMIAKPKALPMWTHDLMQECERLGNPRMPEQPDGVHNALADARWVKHRFEWLQENHA